MRCLTLLLCLPTLVAAQDAQEILRKALANDTKATGAEQNYTYLEHLQVRTQEGGGKYKIRQDETHDITLLEGSPYRRLIAQDGKPLDAKEQAKEQQKLQLSIEERRHETEAQRQQRIADWRHKREKQHEPLHEIPDAFNLKLAADDKIDGRDVYVIEASPKPGYKPKTKNSFFLPKVKMRMWIAKQDFQPVKVEFETLDTISWGGVVARVAKGTHLRVEMVRVNDEVWLPKRILLSGSARVMLVKGFTGDVDLTYSDYKRFSTESHVVTAQ
jgi:hypothetical protein